MPGPRSTRAPIIRCRDSVVAAGRVRLGTILGAQRDDPSRRRGASMRAAAGRCAAMAISGSARATSTAIRSAAAAWPNSRSRRAIRLKAFGGNFGDRAVPRRRDAVDRAPCPSIKDWQFGAGHRRALLFELRPDPDRRRHAAQSAKGRRPDRGGRLARAGLLMAETRHSGEQRASGRRFGCGSDWPRRLADRTAGAVGRRCWRLPWAAWSCSTPRRGTASSSTASARSKPRPGLRIPHRPDRGVDLRRGAAEERRGLRPAAACS